MKICRFYFLKFREFRLFRVLGMVFHLSRNGKRSDWQNEVPDVGAALLPYPDRFNLVIVRRLVLPKRMRQTLDTNQC